MRLLAIETSCDETSAAVVEKLDSNVLLHSNITASSANMHAQTGGIIPENAAREQLRAILPVITEALLKSEKITVKDQNEAFALSNKIIAEKIDSIAVTVGPGLIGSLLVGVETAKTLSFIHNKPLYQINHLLGHIYANFLVENETDNKRIEFPFIGLIISGGHTDLLFFKSHTEYKWLGGTRDDAAGEALDKIGRMLDISYPAGQEIEKRALVATDKNLSFQSPLIHDHSYDFSFSGLKTEVMRYVKKTTLNPDTIKSICYATQNAAMKVVVKKTLQALNEFDTHTLLVGGGVAANNYLRESLSHEAMKQKMNLKLFIPPAYLCADNAAMIGARAASSEQALYWESAKALPELYF